ncbi:hypothetical protein BDY17DRAFT_328356 [Neohortaea acidophila]|uniref:Uncharacterized protein n=1 Tax=Neohortaea acidophila TaxID=245834 RepID=A0A6A6PGU4_9PEZI|nr:uncharacterized protein BDY17DRAFT_328356 [Neohortaea acidophila]KAF2478843.1 hypothetical protein BDY17DRAFT_328356 [Neohortaea acidophila]
MSDSSSYQYAAAGTLLLVLLAFVLFQPNGLARWLQKKNYQYEVTFALYMLTPTEKFIFNSILFLTLSMLTTACCVYLPSHILLISRRAYYYFAGGDATFLGASRTAASHLGGTAAKASEAVYDATANMVGAAFGAAANASAAAGEEVAGQVADSVG